jgi:hypothetical protein
MAADHEPLGQRGKARRTGFRADREPRRARAIVTEDEILGWLEDRERHLDADFDSDEGVMS